MQQTMLATMQNRHLFKCKKIILDTLFVNIYKWELRYNWRCVSHFSHN